MDSIENLLDYPTDDNELAGEATVRDSDESIEVLLLRYDPEGLSVLEEEHRLLRFCHDQPLSQEDAMLLARQRLRLPAALCNPWRIRQTIDELVEMNKTLTLWQQNPWLKGELFLVLEKAGDVWLNGHHLCYSVENGLTIEKEGDEHPAGNV